MKGVFVLLSALACIFISNNLLAQQVLMADPNIVHNQSVIGKNMGSLASGATSINMVAGDFNAQMNLKALAATSGRGVAQATVSGLQMMEGNRVLGDSASFGRATIGSGAFSNSSGLLSVNQASGVGNAQANGVAIAIGVEGAGIAESELGAVITGNSLDNLDRSVRNSRQVVAVDGDAFDGSRGVVQINQLAGSGNATANNFALSVSLGAAK